MADYIDDDELDLEDPNKKKVQPQPTPSVGRPIGPPAPGATPGSLSTATPSMGSVGRPIKTNPTAPPAGPSPELTGTPEPAGLTPGASTVAPAPAMPIGSPISPNVPAPRPAGQHLEALAAQGPPEYHGIKRFLDTLGGATNLGQAIERGSGMGTLGYEQKLANAGTAAKAEEGQIEAGERERLRNAQTEEQSALAKQHGAAAEMVTITDPVSGHTMQVPAGQAAQVWRAIVTGQAGIAKQETANEGRLDVAQLEADNKLAVQQGKPQPHIIKMVGGQPHIMSYNPANQQYDQDKGLAPPNYAEIAPSLKTVDIISPNSGQPTVTTLGGREVGVAATGTYGTEAAQAGVVTRAGTELINDIKANRQAYSGDQLGTLSAWVQKYGLDTPIANPVLAKLQAEISTFAALQPAMHGFRARSAMEAFQAILGGLQKNPEATIASIEGILKTAHNINPQMPAGGGGQGGRANEPARPPGVPPDAHWDPKTRHWIK